MSADSRVRQSTDPERETSGVCCQKPCHEQKATNEDPSLRSDCYLVPLRRVCSASASAAEGAGSDSAEGADGARRCRRSRISPIRLGSGWLGPDQCHCICVGSVHAVCSDLCSALPLPLRVVRVHLVVVLCHWAQQRLAVLVEARSSTDPGAWSARSRCCLALPLCSLLRTQSCIGGFPRPSAHAPPAAQHNATQRWACVARAPSTPAITVAPAATVAKLSGFGARCMQRSAGRAERESDRGAGLALTLAPPSVALTSSA